MSRMVFRERKRKAVDLALNVTSLIDVLFLLAFSAGLCYAAFWAVQTLRAGL